MAGSGSSLMYSFFFLFTFILSLQMMYRGKLASSELFTILGGFISSLLFLVLLTFIGNFHEANGIGLVGVSILLIKVREEKAFSTFYIVISCCTELKLETDSYKHETKEADRVKTVIGNHTIAKTKPAIEPGDPTEEDIETLFTGLEYTNLVQRNVDSLYTEEDIKIFFSLITCIFLILVIDSNTIY
ncbi:hypothetical protein GQ457_13G017160 [Hibiscus cannabinus]